jgi:hypothetical protein
VLWRAERTVLAVRVCKSTLTSASERSGSPAVRAPFRGWADEFKRMCASLLSAPVCGNVLGFVIANDF